MHCARALFYLISNLLNNVYVIFVFFGRYKAIDEACRLQCCLKRALGSGLLVLKKLTMIGYQRRSRILQKKFKHCVERTGKKTVLKSKKIY
jgi:hypothetical protein